MKQYPVLAALAGALLAGPALSAGLDQAVLEPPPVATAAPATPATMPSFAGGYVGGSLGYGHLDASDAADLLKAPFLDFLGDGADDFVDDTFDLEDGGLGYGLHAGYNVQRGSVVFGPELAVFGGDVEIGGVSEFDDGLTEETLDADVNHGARLALRGGIARNRTLFYGTLGAAYLNVSVETDGVTLGASSQDQDGFGYAAGFGVERLLNERVSVGAQYSLHRFGDFDLGDDLEADLEHRTLDLRLSLKF